MSAKQKPPPPDWSEEARFREFEEFVDLMRERLREEEDAGRKEWSCLTAPQLMTRFLEEVSEVFSAVSNGLPEADVMRACADAANYAAFIATVVAVRGLEETGPLLIPVL